MQKSVSHNERRINSPFPYASYHVCLPVCSPVYLSIFNAACNACSTERTSTTSIPFG